MMKEAMISRRRCPSCGKTKILTDENSGEIMGTLYNYIEEGIDSVRVDGFTTPPSSSSDFSTFVNDNKRIYCRDWYCNGCSFDGDDFTITCDAAQATCPALGY